MLNCTIHPLGELDDYTFVAILSRWQGKLLLSRKRGSAAWETQGGHIEPGETPQQAAERELFEESGALEFTLQPVCDYAAAGTTGVFFFAEIAALGPLPASEMEEVRSFGALPEALTYPGITPRLYAQVAQRFAPGPANS